MDEIAEFCEEYVDRNLKRWEHDYFRKGSSLILLDLGEIQKENYKVVEYIIEEPEEFKRKIEFLIQEKSITKTKPNITYTNIPKSLTKQINKINHQDEGKLFYFEGILKKSTDMIKLITRRRFECPSCGAVINIPQNENKLRQPSKCSCGRKGHFREVSNTAKILQIFDIEDIIQSDIPKSLTCYLIFDNFAEQYVLNEKLGNKVRIIGHLTDTPFFALNKFKNQNMHNLFFCVNNIEFLEQSYKEIEITEKDIEKMTAFSKQPADDILFQLANCIGIELYGMYPVKKALILQQFEGSKVKNKRSKTHILLCGDPSCFVAGTRISTSKGLIKIENLGKNHLDPINIKTQILRKNPYQNPFDLATQFHEYKNIDTYKLTLESGKETICSYNQKFLTKKGWRKITDLKKGEKIRIAKSLIKNHTIQKLKNGQEINKDIAYLMGYLLGDGWIHFKKYKNKKKPYHIGFCVNEKEKDLIPYLKKCMFKLYPKKGYEQWKIARSHYWNNIFFKGTQKIYYYEISNIKLGDLFKKWLGKSKKIPEEIFRSSKKTIASFIKGLYDADGCVYFKKGKNRYMKGIGFKQNNKRLLLDLQLLLLHFGIESRIIENNLHIRKANEIIKFEKHINFNSKLKKEKLRKLSNYCKKIRKNKLKRFEKIIDIKYKGKKTVYDIVVPKNKYFIANGILSHNTGKSTIMRSITEISPKFRRAVGGKTSSVGITGGMIKEELTGRWSIEQGSLTLANEGLFLLDEADKVDADVLGNLNEAMEEGTVTITKVGTNFSLPARISLLASANPKFSDFDIRSSFFDQIVMDKALLSRFDIIFILRDTKEDERIDGIMNKIFRKSEAKQVLSNEFIRKYIAYAKKNFNPTWTSEATKLVKQEFKKLLKLSQNTIPLRIRQLEGLKRIAEAYSKMQLKNEVAKKDAQASIKIFKNYLKDFGIGEDLEVGVIEMVKESKMNKKIYVLSILKNLFQNNKELSHQEIIDALKTKGYSEVRIEKEIIPKLLAEGEIFEHKNGIYKQM